MSIKDILKALRPLKKRVHFNTGLFCLLVCLCAAGIITMGISYISLFISVPYLLHKIIYIYAAFTTSGIFVSIFLVPGNQSLIKTADSLGLKERLITAWQLQNEDSPIAKLQRQDTYNIISNTDFKRLYPVRFPTKLAMVLAGSVILTSVSFTIPAYARENAEMIEKLQVTVKEQLEKIKDITDELEKDSELKEFELDIILNEIDRLSDELKKSKSGEDALKAVSRTENQLKKLDRQEQLNKLSEAFTWNDIKDKFGEDIKNDSITDLKQALEQLMQQTAGQQVADSQELNESVLQNLEGMLSEMMQSLENTSMQQALGQLTQAMQQAKSSISKVNGRLSAGSTNNESSSNTSSGQNSEQSSKQKSDQLAGQSSGQLKENSVNKAFDQVSGEGGSTGKVLNDNRGSAGEGSTNKEFGYTGNEKTGSGRDSGQGYEERFEQLYDPDHIGGDADPSYVAGEKQEGGNSSYSQVEQALVQKGAILQYREVLSRYSNEAASYMEETDIPASMKEIVRKYFESLE